MFHVYVEGVTGTAPDAMRALAEAMSARYGLPAAELLTRLARGRFRVKSNVDRATAQIYARDLEALGARVRIEAAAPEVSGDRTDTHAPRRTSPAVVQRAGTPTRETAPPWRSGPSLVPVQRDAPGGDGARPAASQGARGPVATVAGEGARGPKAPVASDVLPPAQARGPKPQLMSVPPAPELLPVGATLPEDAEPPLAPPGRRATRPSLPPQPVRPTTSPLPAHVPSRATRPSLPPQAMRPTTSPLPAHLASRPQTPSLPPQQEARPKRSSLPIPVLGEDDLADELGSLGALDGDQLSLTSLDGHDEPARPSHAGLPASFGPAAVRPSTPGRATGTPARAQPPQPRPSDADLFAPPEAGDAELVVDLADDELERQARKRLSTPPAMAAERRDEPAPRTSSPALPALPDQPPPDPNRGRGRAEALPSDASAPTRASASRIASASVATAHALTANVGASSASHSGAGQRTSASIAGADIGGAGIARAGGGADADGRDAPLFSMARLAAPRARLAAGVLLAILLGFIPASIIASAREHRADHAIDAKVTAAQVAADSVDSYAELDALRAEQLRAKQHAHRMIALTSLLIWAAASGGLAYVWFRRVPWDRWA